MSTHPSLSVMRTQRVVPVVRRSSKEEADHECALFLAAGYRAVELTLTTPGAFDLISAYRDRGVHVGAGSVLDRSDLDRAVTAGATFVVSPVNPVWFLPAAADAGVVAVPGAASPTEIFQAVESGAPLVKVFPIARLGGARYIKDVLAPMPDLQLMATGGIASQAAAELLDAGCVAVGMGSILTDMTLGDVDSRAAAALVRLGAS